MNIAPQIAKHFKEVHVGGNWTSVNIQDSLANISWQDATTKCYGLNSIAALVFHINYYVSIVLKVLQGQSLNGNDKFSFDLPRITNEEDWQKLVAKTLGDAELFASLVEQLPEERLLKDFSENKYGNYYRNIHGIIEHTHYHLGQIVIIKKLLLKQKTIQDCK